MKLSVLMLTYNQERYVARAIDSVLVQQVSFDFEVVIGDDCSSDGTRGILSSYQNAYPDKIRVLMSPVNRGATRNFMRTFAACRGEYVALLEGDDYWLAPDKLSRQVALLDTEPPMVMCFTNSVVVDEKGVVIQAERVPAEKKRNLTHSEIVAGYCPPTNTVVFRKAPVRKLPDSFQKIVNVDFVLYAMLTRFGIAGYLDDITAAYRKHAGGIWSQKSRGYIMKNNLRTRRYLLGVVDGQEKAGLLSLIYSYYNDYILYCAESNFDKEYVLTYLSFMMFNAKHRCEPFLRHLLWFRYGVTKIIRRRLQPAASR